MHLCNVLCNNTTLFISKLNVSEGIHGWFMQYAHTQARSQQFLWGGVLFEENVDLILQPIKVQEQLKSLCSVCIAHIHEGIQ